MATLDPAGPLLPVPDLTELEQIVARGEGTQVEFKATTGQRSEAARTVCAMLNGAGGFLLFGVTDDGRVTGQQVSAETLEGVVRELRRIEPRALVAPETVPLPNGMAVVLVRVPKGVGGPYAYDGRPYVRVGPTTQVMSPEEYQRLSVERMHPAARWEILPAEGVGPADLDDDEIVRTAEEAIRRGRMEDPGTRRPEDLLLGLGLVREGKLVNAAVVLFGRRDRLLPCYPQCALRMARFRGRDMAEFEDNRHEVGNAFELFRRAQRFLRDHLPVAGRVVPSLFERVDDTLYPLAALREALANALCHRDYGVAGGSVGIAVYDDRLEILSTGPLRFGLTPEHLHLPHPSKPWNPAIAGVFYRRGFVETWGSGTIKITELTQRAGLVRPEFEERAGEVVVRFFPDGYVPPTRVAHDLTPLQRDILISLADGGPASSVRLRERMGSTVSETRLLAALNHLRHLGLIEKTGVTRGATWRLFGKESGG